jgi:hypothetical protein
MEMHTRRSLGDIHGIVVERRRSRQLNVRTLANILARLLRRWVTP